MRPSTTLCLLLAAASDVIAIPARQIQRRYLNTSSSSAVTTDTSTVNSNLPNIVSGTTKHKSRIKVVTSQLDPSTYATIFPPFNPLWKITGDSVLTGKPSLPQNRTNGRSHLGTFNANSYGPWKGQSEWGVSDEFPWGNKTAKNTNTYVDPPITGKVQYYDFTVERATIAPDGVERSMILVNGAFPGPTIEANWGDTISVTIHNKIVGPPEGTSFHWHGFLQKQSQWEDGVPGVTQCPIPPGESHTYTFTADLYGTSWWHAHFSAQYSAGLYGAIIVHGPDQEELRNKYDSDLGPLLIADYHHRDYYSIVQDVMGTDKTKVSPKSDNNLINGKGIFNCSLNSVGPAGKNVTGTLPCTEDAGLAKFSVTSGNTYRLRLINAGVEGLQKFSIDDHQLTVIAYDFVPIVPITTNIVTLGVGQRADILVKANKNATGAYWIRSVMTKCSLTNQPNALAILYYENADRNALPPKDGSGRAIDTTDPCANDDLRTAVPYYPIKPASTPDRIQVVDVGMGFNATGSFVFSMNNSTFRTDYNRPILHELKSGLTTDTFPGEWNTYNFSSATSIRIVLYNRTPISHPMHIHGHNVYVLYQSTNSTPINPTLVNMDNPTRRDVAILPPNGTLVLQIEADNPGVWPLHCHIAWHVSSGLYMNIVERPDEIRDMPIPDKNVQLCQKWNDWTSTNVPDQIDSGLKARSEQVQDKITRTNNAFGANNNYNRLNRKLKRDR